MKKYIETALGSVKGRGTCSTLSDLPKLIKHAQSNNLELYRSYYFFDETLKEHLNARNTIVGFNGTPIIDIVTLDIDKGTDTDELTHSRAIACFHLLKEYDIDDINIRVYYSGTGYHIVLPNLWNFKNHMEVKNTLGKLFTDCDTAVYNRSSLIRVANTINHKVQRYKIPLLHRELLNCSTEEILQLATTPRNDIVFPDFEEGNLLEYTKIVVKDILTEQPKMVTEEGISPVLTCIQKMYKEGAKKGSRHVSMLRMVSAFKRGGIPRDGIFIMMKEWGKGMEVGEIRKAVEDTYEKNYAYSCNDELMSKHCDDRCLFFKKKSYNAILPVNVLRLEENYRKSLLENTGYCIELQDYLGIKDSFKIFPEEYVVIEGDTGLGKSALTQNMVIGTNLKTLYLNFEVGENLMTRRFIQIAYAMTKDEVIDYSLDSNNKYLGDKIKHIEMISDRITMHALENIIAVGNFRVIIVDTLECFNVPGINDITPKTEFIAHELKRLAKRYKTIIIAIHHISKGSILDPQGNTKKLNIHAGKGSSAVEQEADKVILLEGEQNNSVRCIRSAKARDERPFQTTMNFDAERTFIFYKGAQWNNTAAVSSETTTSALIGAGMVPVLSSSRDVQFS